jgi:hypothetical protein
MQAWGVWRGVSWLVSSMIFRVVWGRGGGWSGGLRTSTYRGWSRPDLCFCQELMMMGVGMMITGCWLA